MVKNKDAFRALPIKERAALINTYVSGGVMDLGEMRKHYNSFDTGGDTDRGGNIVLNWIRKQLYDKIDPVGYNQFVDRVKTAILGKGEERYNKTRDDIFATYLKIPKDERHNVEGAKKVSDATHTPTKSSEDTNYHKIDLTDKEKDALIYDALRSNANVGDSSRSHVFEQFFGPHQVSRGKDEKGEYVSYYDLWDLDPSSGESKTGEFEFLKSLQKILGAKDMSFGIGKPVEFYDRIYLNDYYGVTPQIDEGVTEGGYLQPAYIEASAVTGSTLTGEDYYNAGESSLPVYSKGGKLNMFDMGGDKDTWYKKLYNWLFNDNDVEETAPQENKYLTNDNYLDEVSKFISTFEEFYPNAYEDTHKGKNIWTVGSGLTYLLDDEGNEIKVKKGDTITQEENINQLNKRLQKNIDYIKSKTKHWDNYPAELKFQLLDAMYNIGAPKVWNPETNYIKAIRQYENEKGWENPEYDLKNIFQHADWNLNNKGWLGIRSRMRRNPQSINVEDFSKIYQNNYRDSLRTAYDIKFQNN